MDTVLIERIGCTLRECDELTIPEIAFAFDWPERPRPFAGLGREMTEEEIWADTLRQAKLTPRQRLEEALARLPV